MTELAASLLVDRLIAASLHGGLLIVFVWAVCRLVPGIPAAMRATLWWLATAKVLIALAPIPSLDLPLLPARDPAPVPAVVASSSSVLPTVVDSTSAAEPVLAATLPSAEPNPARSAASWRNVAAVVWLVFVGAQLVGLLRESITLRRVVRRSTPWPDEGDEVAALSRRMGLAGTPEVMESADITGPQVTGCWRPFILMPSGARDLNDAARAMALCHELAHIRRRDLVLGWGPAIAERLFFFHPLVRLAAREYLTTREAACDAAVVRALGVAPHAYGQLLVHLGIAPSRPVLAASGAPSSTTSLRRRLEMLQHIELSSVRGGRWLIGALLVALVPLQLVARSPEPEQSGSPAPAVVTLPQAAAPANASSEPSRTQPPQSAEPVVSMPASASQVSAGDERAIQQALEAAGQLETDARAEIQRALEDAARSIDARKTERADLLAAMEAANRLRLENAIESLPTTPAYQQMLEELAARSEGQASAGRDALEVALERLAREELANTQRAKEEVAGLMERTREQRARALDALVEQQATELNAQRRVREDSVRSQLERLRVQQDQLSVQLQAIVRQQEELAAAQRQIAEHAERIRQAIEAQRAK